MTSMSQDVSTESDITVPPSKEFGAPFNDSRADLILRSSDRVNFRTYREALAHASPLFSTMLSLPAVPERDGDSPSPQSEIPIIDVSEHSELLHQLLSFVFSYPVTLPHSLGDAFSLISAARKYQMWPATVAMRALFLRGKDNSITEENAFVAYGLACRHRLQKEASIAARATLPKPMTIEYYGSELEFVTGSELYALSQYRSKCIEAIHDLTERIAAGEALELWAVDSDGQRPCSGEYEGNHPKWVTGFFKYLSAEAFSERQFGLLLSINKIEFYMALVSHCGVGRAGTAGVRERDACMFCRDLSETTARIEDFCQTIQDLITAAVQEVEFDCPF